jgi:hypothetical protein
MSKITAQLLEEIERFTRRHGLSDTMFGKMATNDGHLIPDLRAGRDIKASSLERIRAFMADYRPLASRRSESRASAA